MERPSVEMTPSNKLCPQLQGLKAIVSEIKFVMAKALVQVNGCGNCLSLPGKRDVITNWGLFCISDR